MNPTFRISLAVIVSGSLLLGQAPKPAPAPAKPAAANRDFSPRASKKPLFLA